MLPLIRILADFGIAGYVVSFRIVIFVILPSWGLSNAGGDARGPEPRRTKPERVERAVWITGM